jgi:hypothetical protein
MRISAYSRLTKTQKTSAAGLAAAAGIVALTAGVAPGSGGDGAHAAPKPTASHSVSAAPASSAKSSGQTPDGGAVHTVKNGGVKTAALRLPETGHATQAKAVHKQEQHVKAQQAGKAKDVRGDKSASRSADRVVSSHGNLDNWIKEARSIMKKKGIPGSYEGIKKNVMRESGGNPNIQNNWDINAKKGTPSKGLLQVIQPTFDQYHVKGTKDKITDPVANITAACNYAADRYGSMDNVNSAY